MQMPESTAPPIATRGANSFPLVQRLLTAGWQRQTNAGQKLILDVGLHKDAQNSRGHCPPAVIGEGRYDDDWCREA